MFERGRKRKEEGGGEHEKRQWHELAAVSQWHPSLSPLFLSRSLPSLPLKTNKGPLTCFFLPFPAGTVAFLGALARAGMVACFFLLSERGR